MTTADLRVITSEDAWSLRCYFDGGTDVTDEWRLFRLMGPVSGQRDNLPDGEEWAQLHIGPGDIALCAECVALVEARRVRALIDRWAASMGPVDVDRVAERLAPLALRLVDRLAGRGVTPAAWAGGARTPALRAGGVRV